MKKLFMICCVMVCVNMSHLAYSDPYSVTTTVTNLGINSYMSLLQNDQQFHLRQKNKVTY